jgi:hypothetical protein
MIGLEQLTTDRQERALWKRLTISRGGPKGGAAVLVRRLAVWMAGGESLTCQSDYKSETFPSVQPHLGISSPPDPSTVLYAVSITG